MGEPKAENEEGEEECGFCIFMKAGGCKDSFTDWSKCVDEHREGSKDFTEECKDSTLALQDCMMQHKDYYKDFIGLADGADGDETPEDKPDKSEEKGSEGTKGSGGGSGETQDSGKQGGGASSEKAEDGGAGKDEKPGKESSKKEDSKEKGSDGKDGSKDSQPQDKGSDPNTSKRLEDTPAEKHNEAAKDTENKQARTHEQETNPVKAKPDEDKKKEAAEKPPHPEREENRQEASQNEESSKESAGGNEEEEEEEEEDKPPEIKLGTAPYDRRFVTTNQARHCYTRYQEYHRCAKEKGEDDKDCSFFRKAYRAICPGDWVDSWNEQREEGTFPGRY